MDLHSYERMTVAFPDSYRFNLGDVRFINLLLPNSKY